jgi:hypothetical protein
MKNENQARRGNIRKCNGGRGAARNAGADLSACFRKSLFNVPFNTWRRTGGGFCGVIAERAQTSVIRVANLTREI